MVAAKKKGKKKKNPGGLAHAVIGMFYSMVANQRQPQYIQCLTASMPSEANYYMCILRGRGGGVYSFVAKRSRAYSMFPARRGWTLSVD